MPPEELSLRALNRALLSRQLPLDRRDLPDDSDGRRAAVISAIEHLVGLQAHRQTSGSPLSDDAGPAQGRSGAAEDLIKNFFGGFVLA
jgi:hypothetical protein